MSDDGDAPNKKSGGGGAPRRRWPQEYFAAFAGKTVVRAVEDGQRRRRYQTGRVQSGTVALPQPLVQPGRLLGRLYCVTGRGPGRRAQVTPPAAS